MSACRLCPRNCGADRSKGPGFCGPAKLKIARADLHFFEEPPISGSRGSGTIFFCGCSLRCVFCQNYAVSRNETGREITVGELAGIFRSLEDRGAHNINLVTPDHFSEEIFEALSIYRPRIPVVWNTHSYVTPETARRIAGFADVFLADLKYFSPEISLRYAGAANYFQNALAAIQIWAQKKPRQYDGAGMLTQGVLIRHLILPMNPDETYAILDAVKSEIPDPLVSLMAQYTPFGELPYPELRRPITAREYRRAVEHMRALGLDGFIQERESGSTFYIPDWNLK